MTGEEAIVARTKADGTINGLIAGRFYGTHLPEGAAFPCIRWLPVVERGEQAHGDTGRVLYRRVVLQFDFYAANAATVTTLINRFLELWESYRGTSGGVRFMGSVLRNRRIGFEESWNMERGLVELELAWQE